jgi:ankyrin repeat protein
MRAPSRLLLLVGLLFVAVVVLFAVVHRDRRPRIYFAAEGGDTNSLAQYLALGSNVNDGIVCYVYGHRRATLLHIASSSGQPGAVDLLLKKGANPNLNDYSGDTPLLSAIGHGESQGTVDALRLLLKGGADPNLKSASGFWTPLILASELSQTQMVSVLLAGGASVRMTNSDGLTPLHYSGNADVARLLIAAGSDPKARGAGETPAESAIRLGHFSALSVLTNEAYQTNQ